MSRIFTPVLIFITLIGCQLFAPPPQPQPIPEAPPIELIEVVMAVQDIPAGTIITENMVAQIFFPIDYAPYSAFTDLEIVIGNRARGDIARETIILSRLLMPVDEDDTLRYYEIVCVAAEDLITGDTIIAEQVYVERQFLEALQSDAPLVEHNGQCSSFPGQALHNIPRFAPVYASDVGN